MLERDLLVNKNALNSLKQLKIQLEKIHLDKKTIESK